MKQFLKKLIVTCNMLEKYAYSHAGDIGKIMYTECGYKENDLPPQKGCREKTSDGKPRRKAAAQKI